MRVLIDTTAARLAPHSGTGIYIAQLRAALWAEPDLEVLSAGNPRRRAPGGGGLRSAANVAADLWWCRWELPRVARRTRAELVHHPLAPLHLAPGLRHVVTLHDLAFERLPECFDPRWRAVAHHTQRAAARGAAAVVAVSQTTAADARELWGVESVVALHGPGQLAPGAVSLAAQPRHFLYVGDGEPRKNLPLLLAAYASYRGGQADPLPLVLAGSASGAGEGVLRRPDLDWSALLELLGGAAALVQPSRYEGFGLTALEAMAAGLPVLAARSPGLSEICAGAALYADSDDPQGWARALTRLATEPRLRHALAARGRRRAGDFSWARSARAHRAAYSLSLESR